MRGQNCPHQTIPRTFTRANQSGREPKRALCFFQNLIIWRMMTAEVLLHLKETQDHRQTLTQKEGHQAQDHLDHLRQ